MNDYQYMYLHFFGQSFILILCAYIVNPFVRMNMLIHINNAK